MIAAVSTVIVALTAVTTLLESVLRILGGLANLRGISKTFGDTVAVDDLSFTSSLASSFRSWDRAVGKTTAFDRGFERPDGPHPTMDRLHQRAATAAISASCSVMRCSRI
jgi:hypothetical protein